MKNNDLRYSEYTDIEYYNNGAKDATIPEEVIIMVLRMLLFLKK